MRFHHLSRPVLVAAAAAVLIQCGDDNLTGPAFERNDPGTGTSTLRVIADIEVEDESGGDYVTAVHVSVHTAAGAAVSGAAVLISAPGIGTVTVPETAAGSGEYVVVQPNAPAGDIRLDVTRASDNVARVTVGWLGLHTITLPQQGAAVDETQPLMVRWTVPAMGSSAELETRDFSVEDLPDDGEYSVPVASNPPRSDQRIRVYRVNQVDLAGGVAGSLLRISVRDTVEPVIVQ